MPRMEHFRLAIEPQSAFATPLRGDTLFGHLCWALRDGLGESRLRELLQGYTEDRPFAVVSDPFPEHCWPRPAVPPVVFGSLDPRERKSATKRVWLRHHDFTRPIGEWLRCMVEDPGSADDAGYTNPPHPRDREQGNSQGGRAPDVATEPTPTRSASLVHEETRLRNSIDRRTGTTSDEGFAPYGVAQFRYRPGTRLDCHLIFDAGRIDAGTLREAMTAIGRFGYGRDATVGLGRFAVESEASGGHSALPLAQNGATSWLTLAPMAPQGLPWNPGRCWYRPFTRFGRHGNAAVHTGNPFKAPVLLADTGAVLTPADGCEPRLFVGQGLGGERRPLSLGLPETVHQGYAPVIGVRIPQRPGEDDVS